MGSTPEELSEMGGKPDPSPSPPTKAGPLSSRIKTIKMPTSKQECSPGYIGSPDVPLKTTPSAPKKPKRPPPKRLMMFDGFDERGYHPTLIFRLVARQDGAIVKMQQQWRHKVSDDPEWRWVNVIAESDEI